MDALVLVAVVAAGGLGAGVRFVAVEGWPGRPRQRGGESGPRLAPAWRLMIVNVVASLIAGFAAGLLPLPTDASIVVISGFCGGMSSWSSVMLDATRALRARELGRLGMVVVAQLLWGVFAALIGLILGQTLAG